MKMFWASSALSSPFVNLYLSFPNFHVETAYNEILFVKHFFGKLSILLYPGLTIVRQDRHPQHNQSSFVCFNLVTFDDEQGMSRIYLPHSPMSIVTKSRCFAGYTAAL